MESFRQDKLPNLLIFNRKEEPLPPSIVAPFVAILGAFLTGLSCHEKVLDLLLFIAIFSVLNVWTPTVAIVLLT